MAYQTVITNWLLDHTREFDLKISEFEWPSKENFKIFDFEVNISFRGISAQGRGTDRSELFALEKASAEAIERLICMDQKISTIGVAVHVSRHLAEANAQSEAVERFLFERSLKEGVGLPKIIKKNYIDITEYLKTLDSDAEVQFFQFGAQGDFVGILCLVTKGKNQKFIGLSFECSKKKALEKSFIEAARNLKAFIANPVQYQTEVAANSDLWAGDSKYIENISFLFKNPSLKVSETSLKVSLEELNLNAFAAFNNQPFSICRARIT